MSRKKVLIVNIASALATTVFALITFALGAADKLPLGALLGISAGFLLYIAMSDVIPSIHDQAPKKKLLDFRPILLLVGVIAVAIVIRVAGSFITE